jgi:hypothetical protein
LVWLYCMLLAINKSRTHTEREDEREKTRERERERENENRLFLIILRFDAVSCYAAVAAISCSNWKYKSVFLREHVSFMVLESYMCYPLLCSHQMLIKTAGQRLRVLSCA